MTTLYGIKSCDTMKKAMTWLTNHNIEYTFFDYKKETISADWLTQMLAEHGLAIVMNKRGTTYRKLDDETKTLLNDEATPVSQVIALLCANSSMIKRPILTHGKRSIVGFKDSDYEAFFA